jgi:hypothetical protein
MRGDSLAGRRAVVPDAVGRCTLNAAVDPQLERRLVSSDFRSSDILVSKFCLSNSTCVATTRDFRAFAPRATSDLGYATAASDWTVRGASDFLLDAEGEKRDVAAREAARVEVVQSDARRRMAYYAETFGGLAAGGADAD